MSCRKVEAAQHAVFMSAAQNAQVDVNSGRETTDSFPLKGEDYEDVLPAPLCRDASTVLSKSPSDEYRTMNKRRRFYSRRKRGKTLFGLKNAVSQRQSDWNGSENQVYQLKRSASTSSDVSQRFLLRPSRRIFKLFSLKRRGANLPHRFRRFGKTHIPQQSSTEFQHRSELFRGLASKPFENDLKAFQPILPDSPLATSSCTSLTSGMKKPCDRGLLTAHTRSRKFRLFVTLGLMYVFFPEFSVLSVKSNVGYFLFLFLKLCCSLL